MFFILIKNLGNKVSSLVPRPWLYATVCALLVLAVLGSIYHQMNSVKSPPPPDSYFRELRLRIGSIQESCGQVCENSEEPSANHNSTNRLIEPLRKTVECRALYANKDIDKSSGLQEPLEEIPSFLHPEFTYGSRVPVSSWYFGGPPGSYHTVYWSELFVEFLRLRFRLGYPAATYGRDIVFKMWKQLTNGNMDVRGKHVLVVGSESPWIEAVLLEAGADLVTTLDYVAIKSSHPQVKAIEPWKMSENYLRGSQEKFDAMVSFSSLEHSGLGRYGDGLNPWGDLITMSRVWCILKPGARVMIGVPSGKDRIYFNAARTYGPIMLAHLFANYEVIYSEAESFEDDLNHSSEYQPIFVLRKME